MTTTARIPLLKDHHTHPFLYASLAGCPDLTAIHDRSRALELMEESCAPDEINVVLGWNDSRYDFSPPELERFPPLVILNTSLHFLIMNRPAAERVIPLLPELAEHAHDREWIERNCSRLLGLIMGFRPCGEARLRSFFHDLALRGVWYAEEMSLAGAEEIALLGKEGLMERTALWTDPATWEALDREARSRVRGIKLFADGALGARTARLSLPYPGGREGVLVYRDDQLADQLAWVGETGREVAIHAIGDAAIDQVVAMVGRLTRRPPRIRLEHCQFISRETALRARDLGITLCMQPNFSPESIAYRDRLPEALLDANNPFRMLIDDAGFVPGSDLLLGSDGMPHGARQALEGALFPPLSGQRLSLDEFVAGYCMPDLANGFIDITVDHDRKSVATLVTLRS